MPLNDLIIFRKGNISAWNNSNPILNSGEPGLDLSNNQLKIGDGISSWSSLIPVNYNLNNYSITGVGNINISGNITANTGNFDVVSFDTNNESILTKGQISWDNTEGTMDIGLTDNTTIHIGSHRYFRVRNETGGTLYKGQVVYASGVHANGIIKPAPYVADGTIREVRFMGVVLENVNNQNNGYAIDFGHLEEMDLDGSATNYAVGDETWNAGDILYVHPTVAGKLTKNEPKHSISVAIVLDPGNGNGNGRMFVRPTSYGHLNDNHDVSISGLVDGQYLVYNASSDVWTNTTVNPGGGTSITNYSDNRVLTSDGSSTGINAETNLVFIPSSSGNKLGIGTTNPNGNLSLSNGNFFIDGDSQKSFLTVRNSTTNNTLTTLYLDSLSTKIVLPPKSVWNFNVNLSCYNDTNEGAGSWNFKGCIKRTSTTTALVGSIIEENFIDSNLDGVSAYVVANTGTSSLDINVSGLNNNNIRWTAGVDFVQTRYDNTNYFLPMKFNLVP